MKQNNKTMVKVSNMTLHRESNRCEEGRKWCRVHISLLIFESHAQYMQEKKKNHHQIRLSIWFSHVIHREEGFHFMNYDILHSDVT